MAGRTVPTGLRDGVRGADFSDWSDGWSGFEVLSAFAVGVGGAAPELAVGFAGGAAAHGLSAGGTEWGRCWARAAWRRCLLEWREDGLRNPHSESEGYFE